MKTKKITKIVGVALGAVLAVSAVGAFAACDADETEDNVAAELSGSEIIVSTSGDSVNVNVNVDMQGAFDLFHNHVYSATAMSGAEPTCTKDGYGYYTCECGAQYSDVIPALGHDLYVTEDGYYRCSNCGTIFSVMNDDGHEYSSDAIYVPAEGEEDAKWVTFCVDEDCKYIKELESDELSGYTRVVTAAEAFGEKETEKNTSYGQSASDSYRIVESGKYVVKKDVSASLKIPKGAEVEIDLGGKSISPEGAEHTIFILPAASLTLSDSSSSGAGAVYAGETGAAIYNKEGCVEIASGTIARVGDDVDLDAETQESDEGDDETEEGERVFAVIENKGEMKIDSGAVVSATYKGKGTFTWTENVPWEDGNYTDENGNYNTQEFTGEYEETYLLSDRPLIVNGYIEDRTHDEYMERDVGASLKIEGGTFTGGTFIENEVLGSLEISGNGKFTCSEGCVKSYGDLKISGGKFATTAEGSKDGSSGGPVVADAPRLIEICENAETYEIAEGRGVYPEVLVEGGTFSSVVWGYSFAVTSEGGVSTCAKIEIAGGVFNGNFYLGKISDSYAFDEFLIYAGEFASWPGECDDVAYTYEFLAEGCAVEKDSDGIYTVQKEAEDHVHSYEVTKWTWSENGSSCEATLECNTRFCAEKLEGPLKATVSNQTEKIEATCAHGKITIYTATLSYGGKTFTSTYEVEDENSKLPHTYTENSITMSWSYSALFSTVLTRKAGGTFVCTECGDVVEYETESKIETTGADGYYWDTFVAGDGNTYWWKSEDGTTLTDWGVVVNGGYVSHTDYFSDSSGNDEP
ncbi:MAG: hypothetical protein LUD29_01135 [Clostridia bacterium]|nr:hypothetical protein [Clostridia bacterium]